MTLLYVSIDGDDIGRLLTQRIYNSNSDDDVRQFSELVSKVFTNMANWVDESHGTILFCSGDSIFFRIDSARFDQFLAKFAPQEFTLSIGLGNTRKEAHWALNIAKSLGKNRITHFDEVRKDIFGLDGENYHT